MADNTNKLIVLITGANQGIGYYAAQHFAATGKHLVIVGSRDPSKGHKALDTLIAAGASKDVLETVQIDLTSDDSINAAVKTVEEKFGRLDILVNNAAMASVPTPSTRTHYATLYNTNVFGTVVCTEAFLPLLRRSTLPGGKRIIFVSSGTGHFTFTTDPKAAGEKYLPGRMFTIYRSSKSALNMVMVGFADALGEEGFVVGGICPGYCGTSLNDFSGPKHASDGAKVILIAAEADKEKVHSKVINEDGAYPW